MIVSIKIIAEQEIEKEITLNYQNNVNYNNLIMIIQALEEK